MPTMRKEKNLANTLVTAANDYRPRRDMARATAGALRPLVFLPELITDQDPAWRQQAACADSDLDFLPNSRNVKMIAACKKVCSTCPVTEECLQMALEADDKFAICGGYTYKERLALKR